VAPGRGFESVLQELTKPRHPPRPLPGSLGFPLMEIVGNMRLLPIQILGASSLVVIFICLHFSASNSWAAQQDSAPSSPVVDDVSLALLPAPDPAAVARGKQIFTSNCAFCHGANATGGDTGPDLVRSVVVLHDEGKGNSIGPVLEMGRPDRGMPKFSFTEPEIKDIAAFLLFRNQAAANRDTYQVLNLVTGKAEEGERYFRVRCSSCHSTAGDLAHVAKKYDALTLQGRFLYPARPTSDSPISTTDARAQRTAQVTLRDGRSYSGKLVDSDDFSVALVDSSGEYRSWQLDGGKNGIKVELRDPLDGHLRLLSVYTDADVHNVLAYLETLK
jgi:cytochrome c oxidase cbb3-type subunit 3